MTTTHDNRARIPEAMKPLQALLDLSQRRSSRAHDRPQVAPSTQLQEDLRHALGGDASLIAFPWQRRYRNVVNKRCNLALPAPAPLAITFPKHVLQIQEVVQIAARHDLAVQARSGGHSYGNHSLGGSEGSDTIIIDLRHFQYVHVQMPTNDKRTPTARVGAGTRLGHLTRELNAFGLALPHGTCPSVGVGGHATIGGLGPTSRMWGLTLDHIEDATLVKANGEVVKVSATSEHSDLFFALRGAAASFGVVVEFRFRTHPAPSEAVQFSCMVTAKKYGDMAGQFEKWQALVAQPTLTRKLFSQVIITMRGMRITGTYFGSDKEFQQEPFAQKFVYKSSKSVRHQVKTPKVASAEEGGGSFLHHLLPCRRSFRIHHHSAGPNRVTLAVKIQQLDWPALVNEWAGGRLLSKILGRPSAFHSKSCAIPTDQHMSPRAIKQLFEHLDAAKKGTPLWFVIFDLAGGAVNEISKDATTFAHRDIGIYCQSYAISMFGKLYFSSKQFVDDVNKIVVEDINSNQDSRQAYSLVYPGYVDPSLERAQMSYWGSNWLRLEMLKEKYDDDNVFRHPQSILPKLSMRLPEAEEAYYGG